ncbi:MAG TPA: ribosomal-protein-alanine N-acetyltransferase [Desulfarculaceae bacterium]|nr:ribosomal-protein-alanine N-acetyltransferase [Desulfarculaceae bacterium]
MNYVVSHSFSSLENLPEITLLEQQSFTSPWNRESLESELSNPLNLITVIRSSSEAEITGYSLTRILPPEAELLRIAVRPQARGVGVGSVLLNELLQKLFSLKIIQLYLEVSEKNRPAISLYQKIGFTVTGHRPGYYDNGSTGAITFSLAINFGQT